MAEYPDYELGKEVFMCFETELYSNFLFSTSERIKYRSAKGYVIMNNRMRLQLVKKNYQFCDYQIPIIHIYHELAFFTWN